MKKSSYLIKPAKRLQSMATSVIRTYMDQSKDMADQGLPVISFAAGEPDFNTPQKIKEETVRALMENYTHYTSNRGYPPLRRSISEKVAEDTGLSYDPDTEILVTTSGAEAINNSLLAFLDPGDEVIIFSPSFLNYENVAKIAGADVVTVPLRERNGFQISMEDLRRAVTPKTKMLVLNNPCNPSGALFAEGALKELSALACRRNLIVFSDEIYSSLVYDDQPFLSLASFPGMRERTIVMNGFSKTYAMTGWRLGYLCAPQPMISAITKLHQFSTTSSPTFLQVGLARAMNDPDTKREVKEMVRRFSVRRKTAVNMLRRVPNLSFSVPMGAFYLFVNVSATGLSGEEFCSRLLNEKYVATVPGRGFGAEYGEYIRISYATGDDSLMEGMKRIESFAASFPSGPIGPADSKKQQEEMR